MREDFLHYLWKFQLIEISQFTTVQGERIQVLSPGIHNQDSGPDFLNAKIRIEDQIWVGTVEIHLNSSDWYWHQHEIDKKYDAVILHVVWDHDVDIFMRNNQPLPTLELKNRIPVNLLENYQNLSKNTNHWISCETQIHTIEPILFQSWLERLYVQRLERKSKFIGGLLKESRNHWEVVLFWLLFKNFGLNKNADAFFLLARSIPFHVFRKCMNSPFQLEALLFGQSGLCQISSSDAYILAVQQEYRYLQSKFGLRPISDVQFEFFRMRPANFPTVRIAQLSALYSSKEQLFSKILESTSLDEYYELFTIQISKFWETHYTFSKTSKRSSKKLSQSFIDLLIINTILPIKFAFLHPRREQVSSELIELLSQIKPEQNSVVSSFQKLNIESRNAFESQSLIELKKNYCAPKRCLECAIGNKLLRS